MSLGERAEDNTRQTSSPITCEVELPERTPPKAWPLASLLRHGAEGVYKRVDNGRIYVLATDSAYDSRFMFDPERNVTIHPSFIDKDPKFTLIRGASARLSTTNNWTKTVKSPE